MKKTICLFCILILLTGCGGSAFETYSRAINKTGDTVYGKSSTSFSMEIEFNKEGLSPEEIREIELWRKVEYELLETYNRHLDQALIDFYVNIYNIGFQGKIYMHEGTTMLVSPIFPKIILIEDFNQLGNSSMDDLEWGPLSETLDRVKELWVELLNSGDRTSIGNIIVSTPEGELKTKEFVMTLSDEELKPVIRASIEILIEDKFIRDIIEKHDQLHLVFIEDIDKLLESVKVDEFNHRAFIDRDGFVVEETVRIILDFSKINNFSVNKVSMDINAQNWDLGKKVEIEIPEITAENTITIEEIFDRGIGGWTR